MPSNKFAIASISLGQHPSHNLPSKIHSASQHGIQGIEIVFSDLSSHAKTNNLTLQSAANQIKNLCRTSNLHILSLAPLENFEGSQTPLGERLEKAKLWLEIANIMGAEYVQVPANFEKNMNPDHEVHVAELRELADLAAKYGVKIAYENLAWSPYCLNWQEALQMVMNVGRENFGLCLDSFHLAVVLWGDAYAASGKQENGEEKLAKSLSEMVKELPLEKLFYLQLSDGERFVPPYSKEHPWYNEKFDVGHVWSMEARPFPLETEYGGYMPVEAIARAFMMELRFEGWVSSETFDRRMRVKEEGPERGAKRAKVSWDKLMSRLEGGKVKL